MTILYIKNLIASQRVVASMMLALLMTVSAVGSATAQAVLQGYQTDQTLQKGMLVTLTKDDQSKVAPITDKTLDSLKGVVADSNDSPVTLSGEGQKAFVATTGNYEVLVSDQNGSIKKGDYISGSSLAGVGMKANDTQSVVLGRATANFEAGGDVLGKTTISSGKTVALGRVMVDIGVGSSPIQKPPLKDSVPNALEVLANDLAGKSVGAARVYLALTMLLITTAVAGTTLFSGVRSAVISVGRNPLSKGIIYKGLMQVGLLSFIIFITGLFGVYLLIKL